ncbi:MAG: metal ABC transporter solute-binding protein, Zn/Mn family [Acidimicrobiales bacterium]
MRLGTMLRTAGTVALVWAAFPAAGAGAAPRVLRVVAAENFWGSLAAQLGGTRVEISSIVTDPNADPHDYETSPADARMFAAADYVIENGAGYDTWADKLLAAQPRAGRRILDVARFLGRPAGSNPHLWYDPTYVSAVIDRITADLTALDPADRAYFARRHQAVEAALSPYRAALAAIRARYGGTRVASTESVFVYLAAALDLRIVTGSSFMDAVAENVDPPAAALASFERQIAGRDFSVLVYNIQTVTPLTTNLRRAATARHIAVVGISETMEPPTTTFERWMVTELDRVGAALARGTP